jgi:hypothetical protein
MFHCLMIWRRRCLVLVPVLSFLAAALIMSCGGGGSSSGTTTVSNPFAIIGLNVCPGTPPPAPTPTVTKTKTPTPTPTPECSPVSAATVGTAPGSNTVQFNAQGIFNRNNNLNTAKFHDVTNNNSTQWNPSPPTITFPGVIFYQGNGLFVGVTPGCTFFTVSDGGFTQSVVVGVEPAPSPCPTPAFASKPPASPQP